MTNPAHTNLINYPTIAPTDLDASNEEDQLQNGPSMNMESRQEQEVTKESLTMTCKQNRRLLQAAEQQRRQTAWQPTLRALERLSWCVFEHGISKNGIFGQEGRSQDLELARRTLTEPTRSAPRSCVRLTFDNG